MLSRILWISAAFIALIAGIAVQDRWIFGWHDKAHSLKSEHSEHRMDRAIERGFEKMEMTGPDGREIEVPAETKRELANAVSRLIKAEAELAMLRIGDGSEQEIKAERDRIADARADIDRLKIQIKSSEQAAKVERDALREQIRREVREDVRETVREAVAN